MNKDYRPLFKRLILALIVLNIIDGILTVIGINSPKLTEGNPLVAPLLNDLSFFLFFKIVVLSIALLGVLTYVFLLDKGFPKPWENRVVLITAAVVIILYVVVVINNALLIVRFL